MTDDSTAERNALCRAYPNSVVLLCQFHVLWAVWRWLWNSKNGIRQNDRQPLYNLFHDALNAPTAEELGEALNKLNSDDTDMKYDN